MFESRDTDHISNPPEVRQTTIDRFMNCWHIASYPYFGQSHVVYADELFQQGFGERISTGCQIFYELYGLPEALESGSDYEV